MLLEPSGSWRQDVRATDLSVVDSDPLGCCYLTARDEGYRLDTSEYQTAHLCYVAIVKSASFAVAALTRSVVVLLCVL